MVKRRVLMIAAETDEAERVERLLESRGYDVVVETSGASGVRAAVVEQPDCVVVDLELPRRSGWLAYSYLTRSFRTSHIPVVVLSPGGTGAGALISGVEAAL